MFWAWKTLRNLSNDDRYAEDKWIYDSPSNEAIVLICLVRRLAQAKYAAIELSSEMKYVKLAVVVYVLRNTQNLVISRCHFAANGF